MFLIQNIWILSYQVYLFIFSLTDKYMILHHISSCFLILNYFLNNYEQEQISAALDVLIYGEASSIFLSLRQIRKSIFFDIMFVLTFFYFRTINLTLYLFDEKFIEYSSNGNYSILKIIGLLILYFLNYMWTYQIIQKFRK